MQEALRENLRLPGEAAITRAGGQAGTASLRDHTAAVMASDASATAATKDRQMIALVPRTHIASVRSAQSVLSERTTRAEIAAETMRSSGKALQSASQLSGYIDFEKVKAKLAASIDVLSFSLDSIKNSLVNIKIKITECFTKFIFNFKILKKNRFIRTPYSKVAFNAHNFIIIKYYK